VDKILTEQGIDIYRQDFNMDPLEYWRNRDAEEGPDGDRQGITENKHVMGYLAYWDELRCRHPDMLIDSCASGGRRNDLETMRRAVPLWRSDYAYEPVSHQGMTYGISFWIPYHGTGTVASSNAPYYGSGYTDVEPYYFWSNAAPSLGAGFDMRVRELDYETLRKLYNDWKKVSPYYYADYYPLTGYSLDSSVWIGWQFHDPEKGEGVVQVFRRSDSPYVLAQIPLHALEPEADYVFTNLTTGDESSYGGRHVMQQGLPVELPEKPSAGVFLYKKR